MSIERLKDQLKRHEGFRKYPYRDTTGHLTIGYGRNLEFRGITREEAEFLLDEDLRKFSGEVRERIPFSNDLDSVRRAALINMAYNMGINNLLGFERMLLAMKEHKWLKASQEALDSRWARQVGDRAQEISHMILTGEWPEGYADQSGD